MRGSISLDHRPEMKPSRHLGQDRHAQQTSPVRDHELDCLGTNLFGGGNKVTFVLPVLIVDHDHDPASLKRLQGIVYPREFVVHCRFQYALV
jgi:hypothetical protein